MEHNSESDRTSWQLTGLGLDPDRDETWVDQRLDPLPRASLAEGMQLGPYQLLKVIGQGGMGVVYQARHAKLDRIVALKILNIRGGQVDDLARFANEARAAARLVHPGIVPIYDVGEAEGWHYLAGELIDGMGLDLLINRDRPTPRRALEIIACLAEAVEHAHQQGVIHRDLKPSNILIDSKGQPRLTDFGLAYCTDASQRLTQTGTILGTPAYMAPEQVDDEHGAICASTDVHGLGAVLYELLTGYPPFQGETMAKTLIQVLKKLPRAPDKCNPEVPEAYGRVCLNCLEKSQDRRYLSAGALARDCRDLLEDERPVGVQQRRSRNRRLAIGLSLIALCIGVAVVVGLRMSSRGPAKDASPAKVKGQQRPEQDLETPEKVDPLTLVRQRLGRGQILPAARALLRTPKTPQVESLIGELALKLQTLLSSSKKLADADHKLLVKLFAYDSRFFFWHACADWFAADAKRLHWLPPELLERLLIEASRARKLDAISRGAGALLRTRYGERAQRLVDEADRQATQLRHAGGIRMW